MTYLQRWPSNDWQIANCDVGQGDALVLKVAPQQGLVIDTGPDPKLMDRCLKALDINQIPLLILTHPHADHVGGLPGAMHNRKVGKVLRDTDVRQGEVIQLGVIRIEILWPDGAEHDFAEYGGEGSAINNQSIIALIRTPTYSILTTGDAEPEVQSLVSPYITKVDYLKVAHHGSRHQERDFNSRANPDVAIISVGLGNKYGHPADSTVKLFRHVYRTDQDGAIAIDPRKNSVSSSKVGLFGLPVLWRIA